MKEEDNRNYVPLIGFKMNITCCDTMEYERHLHDECDVCGGRSRNEGWAHASGGWGVQGKP